MGLATKNLTFLFSRKDISSGTPPQGKTKQNNPPQKDPQKQKQKRKKKKSIMLEEKEGRE